MSLSLFKDVDMQHVLSVCEGKKFEIVSIKSGKRIVCQEDFCA